jgi:RNA polymerase sigma factor (sigma-70 family)
MATGQLSAVLRHVRGLTHAGQIVDVTDTQLLQRYTSHEDEAAFAMLVQRHGPLVMGVCRRVLGDAHDAEDAFQATFLVLARKAGSIRRPEKLVSWLHQVARHIAGRALADAARRRERERRAGTMRATETSSEAGWQELAQVLDEELQQLSEKYRAPLLLCYLEGKSHAEAADQLGWPLGSVKGRLARARQLLHDRLLRRGVALSAGTLAAFLTKDEMAALVPAVLTACTVRSALSFATGRAAANQAVALAETALRTMALNKGSAGLALLLLVGLLASGAAVLAHQGATEKQPVTQDSVAPSCAAKLPLPPDQADEPLPPGALHRLGTTRFRQTGPMFQIAFATDNKVLATISSDGNIHLWDIATGKNLARYGGMSPNNYHYALDFSPDGKLLAAAVAAGGPTGIRLLDPTNGKEIRTFEKSEDGVEHARFSPDGKLLATWPAENPVIELWDVATGKRLHRLTGHDGSITSFAFSPDSRTLASTSQQDRVIRLWDTATGRQRGQLVGHREDVLAVAYSPDGKTLASAGRDASLLFWDAMTGKELRQGKSYGGINALVFSPDSKTLLTNGWDETPHLWNVATGKELHALDKGGPIFMLALSPDGKTLAAAPSGHSRSVYLWDVASGRRLDPMTGHRDAVHCLSFSPDGKRLLSGSFSEPLCLWDPASCTEIAPPAHGLDGFPAAFSPGGKTFVSQALGEVFYGDGCHKPIRGKVNALVLGDVATGQVLREFEGAEIGVKNIAFSADGKTLAASSYGTDVTRNRLNVWDVATGRSLGKFTGPNTWPLPLAWSPDGKLLAIGGKLQDGAIHLLDAATGKELRRFAGQRNSPVQSVAFSPDGTLLATGSHEPIIRLWKTTTGTEAPPLKGTERGFWPVVFSPESRSLVAACREDNTVRVWELATGRERRRIAGHTRSIQSLAFSPDGQSPVSGSEDTTILVWDLTGQRSKGKPVAPASRTEWNAAWRDLGSDDAGHAYSAVCRMSAAGGSALTFLRAHLRPAVPLTDEQRGHIAWWIADLEAKDFAVRQHASAELERPGETAEPALRKALKERPALETQQRLEALLDKQAGWTPQRLREIRALEVLERIATPEAQAVVAELTRGAPDRRLTREAQAALERLRRRRSYAQIYPAPQSK